MHKLNMIFHRRYFLLQNSKHFLSNTYPFNIKIPRMASLKLQFVLMKLLMHSTRVLNLGLIA